MSATPSARPGPPSARAQRLIGVGVGVAIAIGIAAAVASSGAGSSQPAVVPTVISVAPSAVAPTAVAAPNVEPTPDAAAQAAAAYALMISEVESCNCNLPGTTQQAQEATKP
jgi:hypothetical protein